MHLPLLLLLPLPSHPPTCTHPSTHPLPGCLQAAEDEAETYYDALKRGMAERAAKTKAALDALDPGTRVAMEVRAALCCPGLPACVPTLDSPLVLRCAQVGMSQR